MHQFKPQLSSAMLCGKALVLSVPLLHKTALRRPGHFSLRNLGDSCRENGGSLAQLTSAEDRSHPQAELEDLRDLRTSPAETMQPRQTCIPRAMLRRGAQMRFPGWGLLVVVQRTGMDLQPSHLPGSY